MVPVPTRQRGPIVIWKLFPLPLVKSINEIGRDASGVVRQRELHQKFETLHALSAWVMLALLILHVAGALKHQIFDGQPELARLGLGRFPNDERI